ncbi:hypothetical protein EP51_44650 (plasmid) [Rhodococcus opacus]|uniref:Uncharacterized protein n=1 Tax=Rhodococcus opacus TaxID=37919 RepID=A0A076F156_RHOOP|nr:hypothetical protein EP51_44650 [Rhodococcus opacus]
MGIRGGQSDFQYLSQQLGVTPLFSHSANTGRRVDTPQEGQPYERVTGISALRSVKERYGEQDPDRAADTYTSRNYMTDDILGWVLPYGMPRLPPAM